jgi:site-specific DNA recombinase
MSAVAGYIRCSTSKQMDLGMSLEAQTARILQSHPSARLFVDGGVSAKSQLADRPEGALLLASVEARETKTVCCVKLDRIFRSCQQALATIERWNVMGVNLVVLDLGGDTIDTKTAIGKFFITVMAGAAELERNMCAERTKATMAYLRESNPDGWTSRKSGKFVEQFGNPLRYGQGETLGWVQRLHAQGMTHADIADLMNHDPEAPRPVRGDRWSARAVASMLWRAK